MMKTGALKKAMTPKQTKTTKKVIKKVQKRKITKKVTKTPSTRSPLSNSLFTTHKLSFSTETAPVADQEEQSTPSFTVDYPMPTDVNDPPEFYMGPDLYTARPTGVREASRVIRAFCNTPVEQPISLAINLGLDPRKPNQSVRGMAPVPHGSGGKTVLAVFATGDKAIEAKEAGADIVGAEDLIKEILAGKIEFTRCVATPDMMKHLSKVARVLGPRGLMPNPKLGTVTLNIREAVENSKLGQIEFRNDKKGVVHAIVGKSSWSIDKLEENINAFVKAIAEAKPSGAKGQYFKSSFIGNNSGWSQSLDIRLFPFKQ
jgi:large subunit ribosomal protein L1